MDVQSKNLSFSIFLVILHTEIPALTKTTFWQISSHLCLTLWLLCFVCSAEHHVRFVSDSMTTVFRFCVFSGTPCEICVWRYDYCVLCVQRNPIWDLCLTLWLLCFVCSAEHHVRFVSDAMTTVFCVFSGTPCEICVWRYDYCVLCVQRNTMWDLYLTLWLLCFVCSAEHHVRCNILIIHTNRE